MTGTPPARDPRPSALAGGHLGRIIGAYAAACFSGAVILTVLLILRDLVVGSGLGASGLTDLALVIAGTFLVTVVAAAPFATAVIVAGETWRIGSLWAYLSAGAAIGAAILVLSGLWSGVHGEGPGRWSMIGVFVLAGAGGGGVYWRLAARRLYPAPPRAER